MNTRGTHAQATLQHQLALPVIQKNTDAYYDHDEIFDPWEIFPSIYGSYSEEFDDMAILVLENMLQGSNTGESLAHEMFREMLCVAGLADYGTSPRTCFPEYGVKDALTALLAKWREYRTVEWSE